MQSHYQTLNLPPTCTQADIKKAYRLLAVQYHPDKNNGDKGSEEQFKQLLAAYLVLSDKSKREAYDIANGFKSPHSPKVSADGHTAAVLLLRCRKVKERVFNAGGRINKEALFAHIDAILSSANIEFLIESEQVATTSLIIDEVLVSAIFLDEARKQPVKEKLLQLANGNKHMLNRINTLDAVTKK